MRFKKLVAVLCAGLMMSFVGTGAAVAAPSVDSNHVTVQEYTTDDGYDPVLAYVTNDERGIRFDSERAITDGASEELIAVGEMINVYSFAAQADSDDRLSLPVWGNWCGPGHSGPGAPIDRLDTACMHHDKCYGSKGYLNCACDQALIDEINRYYSKMKATEKVAARAVQAYFTAQKAWCKK